jgi:hypothetical protein
MILHAEVLGRFDRAGDANKLVYSPLATPHTFRTTRRYTLEFDGFAAAARDFVRRTLVDEVSQDVHFGDEPGLAGQAFIVDYGFKPGALDLERETILDYYRGIENPGFTLRHLTITQRLYIFANGSAAPAERFVRDIVNPAIHRHCVIPAG